MLRQLKKITVDISIWGLLMASREHRQALLSLMNKTKLPIEATPDELMSLIMSWEANPMLSFSDKKRPPEGTNHNKPLYVSLECKKKWISMFLVDTRLAINVCPARTTYAIGLKLVDFILTNQAV